MTLSIVYDLIFFAFGFLFAVRWVRWLAIIQQKEYRIDRLFSFLKSPEGLRELFHFIPTAKEFTRTGLKRPVRTVRVMIVALISVSIFAAIEFLSMWFFPGTLTTFFVSIFLYVFLPIISILSCLPSALAAYILTIRTLQKARAKILAAQPKIIGVGGSYGKTSTKHVLAHILTQKYSVFVTPKSHNTKYSIAKSICASFSNQEIALLEYGAYKIGEIAYMTKWFPPVMAIETGFTLQHLGLFGSTQNSLEAEAELVAALPKGGKVFCNAADEGAEKICEIGQKRSQFGVTILPYSGSKTVVEFTKPIINEMGELQFSWNGRKIKTHFVGKQYLVNLQGVVAVAQELGVSDEKIIAGLESFMPNESFMRTRQLKNGAIVIDDGGTSNPKGFAAAIDLAKEMSASRTADTAKSANFFSQKILITGGIVDLGDQTQTVHQELANHAHSLFDTVVYTGIDGREIFKETFGKNFVSEPMEITKLLSSLNEKSLVLIEGRIPKYVTANL